MTKRTRAASAAALPADASPDRRALLASAGAAAALIASTAPGTSAALAAAVPPVDPDAALMALHRDYHRTREAWKLSWPAHTEAEDRYFDLRETNPDRPEHELQQASGLAAITPTFDRLENENHDVVCAMADEPARTLRGVIAKAEVSAIEDNMVPELIASLVADLIAMKAGAP